MKPALRKTLAVVAAALIVPFYAGLYVAILLAVPAEWGLDVLRGKR